jgi:hypothetical protein
MAAKNAARPRPNKNSDGKNKKPSPTMSHEVHVKPGETPEPTPPGVPQPGATNPMTHPNHPQISSGLGSQPPGPQIQERIQFKDLPPTGQSQAMAQLGMDPAQPVKMGQQTIDTAMAQGPSQGPIPNRVAGPGINPEAGVDSFPDDFAHLQTLMQQGYAPGASHQEHGYAANAHSLMREKVAAAFQQGQQGVGQPTPPAPVAPPAPPVPPQGVGLPSQPPAMASGLGGPPQAPGAPGGIPPELIAQLLAKHKRPGVTR